MPKISVAMMTKRPGSIDIAKYGLTRQTFKDFEFLLVDELYEKRHGAVERYFKDSGINLVHINASKEHHRKWKPWDYTVGRSHNLALAYARGELLTFCGDFWVYCPTALEAIWAAWKHWGRQGLMTTLVPSANPTLTVKPHFLKYASERRGTWRQQGASSFLDAPCDTYISIYTQDFNRNPRLVKTGNDPRILSWRIDKTMSDPRVTDPPVYKAEHAGAAGRFKYWKTAAEAAFGLIVPVEDAVKVNGWNYSLCGKWGGWEEINVRMAAAFKHRYLNGMGVFAWQLPHKFDVASWILRFKGKSNKGPQGPEFLAISDKIRRGIFWADNPFNVAEERQKVREGKKTVVFDY